MSPSDVLPMPPLAHIAGVPVEETVASFLPVLAVAGGCFVATLRARLRRLRAAAHPSSVHGSKRSIGMTRTRGSATVNAPTSSSRS